MKSKHVFEFSAEKRVSYDGKSRMIRLPAEVVRFLKEQDCIIEETSFEGVWLLEDGRLAVMMAFHKKQPSEVVEKEDTSYEPEEQTDDENEYAVLGEE